MINYDTERGIKVTKDSSGSTLTLNSAHSDDSGNYTCSPYNIRPASVLVHVLSEGNSAAAVQNEGQQQDKNKMATDSGLNERPAQAASVTERTPPSAAVHSGGPKLGPKIVIPSILLWALLIYPTVFLSDPMVFLGPKTRR